MTIRAALLLAQGFEDAEAIMTLDILNRLGIEVDTISCETSTQLTSYHHVTVVAKRQIDACLDEFYDAIILPGGPEGTQRLAACSHALNWIAAHDHQQQIVAALCSAPARVLGGNQLLKGRHYVCSGDLWQHCTDGIYIDKDVVHDGNLITGRGLGVTFDFAFYLASQLLRESHTAMVQAEHIYHPLNRALF